MHPETPNYLTPRSHLAIIVTKTISLDVILTLLHDVFFYLRLRLGFGRADKSLALRAAIPIRTIVSLFHCISPRTVCSTWIRESCSRRRPLRRRLAACAGYVMYREPIFHEATDDAWKRGYTHTHTNIQSHRTHTENMRRVEEMRASEMLPSDIHALSHRQPTLK